MGTNFYFGKDSNIHIGKRSAAGPYCWDCGVSLASKAYNTYNGEDLYGVDAIHYTATEDWLSTCPICGKEPTLEDLDSSSAGRELGFNRGKPKDKVGVKSCASFSWAISPKKFRELFMESTELIIDEYGNEYTRDSFRDMLSECPVKYYQMVNKNFS